MELIDRDGPLALALDSSRENEIEISRALAEIIAIIAERATQPTPNDSRIYPPPSARGWSPGRSTLLHLAKPAAIR